MNFTMRHIGMTVLVILLFLAQAGADESLVLKTDQDKANYATGVNIVRKLKQQGGEVNLDIVIQAMKDELTDSKLLMTEEDIRKTLADLQIEQMHRRQQAAQTQYDRGTKNSGVATRLSAAGPSGSGDMRQQKPAGSSLRSSQTTSNTAGTFKAERSRARGDAKRKAELLRQKKILQERNGG